MTRINPIAEVAAILNRTLTGAEEKAVRKNIALGRVNPYDIIKVEVL